MNADENARRVAAHCVQRVVDEGGYSNLVLSHALASSPLDARDRAFVTALVYRTLTWLAVIDDELDQRLSRGLESLPRSVRAHLRVAMAQLRTMQSSPPRATINECVEAIKDDSGGGLSRVANGVLRSAQRDGAPPPPWPGAQLALPPTLHKRIVTHIGEDRCAVLMDLANEGLPTHLRQRRPGELPEGVSPHPHVPGAFVLEAGVPVTDASWAVQDAGSQMVGLCVPAADRVLDCCAGTGGKTLHLVDRPDVKSVVASDVSAKKLTALRRATALAESATPVHNWRDGCPDALCAGFDAVLVDAPCSGYGTIGRHPEARWRRSDEQVRDLATVQGDILAAAASAVRPGGILVYAVCTFTTEETDAVCDAFNTIRNDFSPAQAVPGSLIEMPGGRLRVWGDEMESETFFIARWKRAET